MNQSACQKVLITIAAIGSVNNEERVDNCKIHILFIHNVTITIYWKPSIWLKVKLGPTLIQCAYRALFGAFILELLFAASKWLLFLPLWWSWLFNKHKLEMRCCQIYSTSGPLRTEPLIVASKWSLHTTHWWKECLRPPKW